MSRNIVADKKALLDYLHKTPIVEVACKQTGVGRSTYYRWRKDDEEFAEAADNAIEQSTGVINDMAESQLIKAIKNNNMTGIMFWLKSRHPRYRTKVEMQGTLAHTTEILSDEQMLLVQKSLHFAGLISNEVSHEASEDS